MEDSQIHPLKAKLENQILYSERTRKDHLDLFQLDNSKRREFTGLRKIPD